MEVQTLERYLHEQIPASRLLGVRVTTCEKSVIELRAPLEPNINHKNTVFGGSLSIVAILAGWSLVYLQLEGRRNEIVIQESSMSYLKPAHGEFSALCRFDESGKWPRFHRSFDSRGKGRIEVETIVASGGDVVGMFRGSFVAFNTEFG